MAEMKMTELELSNYLIEQGENGKEQSTKEWKEKGFLKTGKNTYVTFMKKVDQYFETVAVEGKGKKRQYTLTLRSEKVEREFGYKGRSETKDEELMKEYIFNKLLKYIPKQTRDITKIGWLKAINLHSSQTLKFDKELYDNIKERYLLLVNQDVSIANVESNVKASWDNKAYDIFNSAINKLAKENRIKVTTVYQAKKGENEYVKISNDIAEVINKDIKNFLAKNNIEMKDYNYAKRNITRLKWILEDVSKFLKDTHGYEFIFDTTKIEIVEEDIKLGVTHDEFNGVFFDKLLKSVQKVEKNSLQKDKLKIHERLRYLNTLLVINHTYKNHTYKNVTELLEEENEYIQLEGGYLILGFEEYIDVINHENIDMTTATIDLADENGIQNLDINYLYTADEIETMLPF